MRLIFRLLIFILVGLAGLCVVIWGSWYNPDMDFIGLSRYAKEFPLGPAKGPLAACFGALALAYVVDTNTPRRQD